MDCARAFISETLNSEACNRLVMTYVIQYIMKLFSSTTAPSLLSLIFVFSFLGCAEKAEVEEKSTTVSFPSQKESEIHLAWLESLPHATTQAENTGKFILMNFTGSDWCPPCQAMEKNVFNQKAFADYAAENLILLKLDFPRNHPQDPDIAKQNQQLAQSIGVKGFPTIILITAEKKSVYGFSSYFPNGPEAFVTLLENKIAEFKNKQN